MDVGKGELEGLEIKVAYNKLYKVYCIMAVLDVGNKSIKVVDTCNPLVDNFDDIVIRTIEGVLAEL